MWHGWQCRLGEAGRGYAVMAQLRLPNSNHETENGLVRSSLWRKEPEGDATAEAGDLLPVIARSREEISGDE